MPTPSSNKKSSKLSRYSGLAFNLLIYVGICIYCGLKIDQYFELKYPIALIILIIFSVAGCIAKLWFEIKK